MCKCKENHWARDWRETQNGRYPASEHAPGCDEYRTEEFAVVEHEGVRCIMERTEAQAMQKEEESCIYGLGIVNLTRDQFEALPEFQGF